MSDIAEILEQYDYAETITKTLANGKLTVTVAEASNKRNRAFGQAMFHVMMRDDVNRLTDVTEDIDATTFAHWGVDYVKLDGCYSLPASQPAGYAVFGDALNATGRPMVYSCEYPFYFFPNDPQHLQKYCNSWRIYGDIQVCAGWKQTSCRDLGS